MLNFLENYDLQNCSTMHLRARARYFCEPKNIDELIEALKYRKAHGLKLNIIGEGSNVYFRPFFDGLIIKAKLQGRQKIASFADTEEWQIASGENWDQTVAFFVEQGLCGLENLSLIPGTVGAAPVQNIGAYGVEVKNFVVKVECLDINTFELVELSNEQCQFGYRKSIFNGNQKGSYFIISVTFQLPTSFKPVLTYPLLRPLQNKTDLTASEIRDLIVTTRRQKFPDYHELGNNGSFFKNSFVSPEFFKDFLDKNPDYPRQFVDPTLSRIKLLSGWLIEHSTATNITNEHFALSDKSKLVLVHKSGRAIADDLEAYVGQIKNAVFTKYGIQLEVEPEVV